MISPRKIQQKMTIQGGLIWYPHYQRWSMESSKHWLRQDYLFPAGNDISNRLPTTSIFQDKSLKKLSQFLIILPMINFNITITNFAFLWAEIE
jgi:hypothetical protein